MSIAVEKCEVPCVCGKGVVTVTVTVGKQDILTYRVEEAVACPACGSKKYELDPLAVKPPQIGP